MENKTDVLICECYSTEHQMIISYGDDCVYIHTHLNKRPFLERLKCGIKYIFGYQCMYGMFDEFIINPNDIGKLQDVIKYLKQIKQNESH